MAPFIYHVVFVSLCLISFKLLSHLKRKRDFKYFTEQNGCKDPRDITLPSFPPGWERLQRMLKLKTSGEDFMDDILVPDFEQTSTIKFTAFDGNTLVSTIEPVNIQAILATQFKDFAVGSRRYNCFKPLLGHSIFTSDGTDITYIQMKVTYLTDIEQDRSGSTLELCSGLNSLARTSTIST